MDFLPPPNTPVVFIACRVFQNWLEHLLPEGLTENITFLDYALHRVPKNLRKTIQEAIDSIEQPSLVLLGYGLCGNGLKDIQAGKHTLLIPRSAARHGGTNRGIEPRARRLYGG